MIRLGFLLLSATVLFQGWALALQNLPNDTAVDCYLPIEGGWFIHLSPDPDAPRMAPGSCIGAVDRGSSYGEGHAFYRPGQGDNPRPHRRLLYPPADKSLVWSEEERGTFPQCGFRPLVLACNEPRFLFDLHSGGGLLGHLQIGVVLKNGASKWFQKWADLTQPVAVDTEAHLVAIPTREGQTLESAHIQAVANDVLFGVMGASVLK